MGKTRNAYRTVTEKFLKTAFSTKFLGLFARYFFPWRWVGSSSQAWMPTYVSILRILQMIWVWIATVEWHWQGKTEELGEKPVSVLLCAPQIPHGLTRARTRASAVRGRRLTTWAVARPLQGIYSVLTESHKRLRQLQGKNKQKNGLGHFSWLCWYASWEKPEINLNEGELGLRNKVCW
jgi:hypothetical protein